MIYIQFGLGVCSHRAERNAFCANTHVFRIQWSDVTNILITGYDIGTTFASSFIAISILWTFIGCMQKGDKPKGC